jgi:hypothetical protein
MTTETAPSLDDLDAAIAAATPDLRDEEQRLAVAVLRLLARGEPVGMPALAVTADLPQDQVQRTLRSWPAVYWDDDDRVVGFWGLALTGMPHRLRHAGVEVDAWCGWDPLFLARVIGDLDVTTHDPVTGDLISYSIAADGTISDSSHPDSVLSFLRPDQPWDDDILTGFCHYVLHFVSAESAQPWTGEHPGTFTITVADGLELARRHTARAFGAGLA